MQQFISRMNLSKNMTEKLFRKFEKKCTIKLMTIKLIIQSLDHSQRKKKRFLSSAEFESQEVSLLQNAIKKLDYFLLDEMPNPFFNELSGYNIKYPISGIIYFVAYKCNKGVGCQHLHLPLELANHKMDAHFFCIFDIYVHQHSSLIRKRRSLKLKTLSYHYCYFIFDVQRVFFAGKSQVNIRAIIGDFET